MVLRTNHIRAMQFEKKNTETTEKKVLWVERSISHCLFLAFSTGSGDLLITLRTHGAKQRRNNRVGVKLAKKLYRMTKSQVNHQNDRQFCTGFFSLSLTVSNPNINQ